MMDGPERDELHRAIWADPDASKEIWQAVLGPGEALFIPQGWWHSMTRCRAIVLKRNCIFCPLYVASEWPNKP
ncbi:hypothetical protein NUW58_g10836 [Xylaria curta]|uniref:Uncharacterized protein n=1 Tax=Xylaria curta TaxID=42375 RepID=A0ACC1MHH4_9PEZI|nr:hypothetical protein NUW58_g10836 [Xylaria curta]